MALLLRLLKLLAIVISAAGLVLLAWLLARLSFEYYPGE
jgi:hypothetical protein